MILTDNTMIDRSEKYFKSQKYIKLYKESVHMMVLDSMIKSWLRFSFFECLKVRYKSLFSGVFLIDYIREFIPII